MLKKSPQSRRKSARKNAKRVLERAITQGLQKLEERIVMDSSSFPTPLNPMAPFGSLVYQGSTAGSFLAAGETDDYSINLDANQRASVVFTPVGSQGATLQLRDPSNNIVATAASPGNGQRTILQSAAVSTPGNYKIEVLGSATSATGNYGVSLLLNAAAESELGSGSNNTLLTAQNLDSSLLSLGGSANRLAVLGTMTPADSDWYSFTFNSGDRVTLTLEGLQVGDLDVELFDASGSRLAQGVEGSRTADEHISGFIATASGSYYARISGQAQDYNLLVTRNAAFDQGSNSTIEVSQPVVTPVVLGAINGTDRIFEADFASGASAFLDGFTATGLWHVTTAARGADLPGHSLNAMAYYGVDATNNFDVGNTSGTLTSPSIVLPVGSSPSLSFVYRLQAESGNPFDRADVQISTNDGATWTNLASNNNAVAIQLTDNSLTWTPITVGLSAYAGSTVRIRYSFNTNGSFNNTGLGWQIDDVAITGTDLVDTYSFAANAGDILTLSTSTPGQGIGAPVNILDPLLELYAPNGSLVASNNNNGADVNALLSYTVPVGGAGTYTARLARVTGSGDYTLNVNGATGTSAVPGQAIVASTIGNGARLSVRPTEIGLTFAEPVLLTTLGMGDVKVNETPVSLLRIDDGRTLVFDLSGVVTGDGSYAITLDPGAITGLQSQGNAIYSSQFTVDTRAPRVVATSIGAASSVNPGEVVLVVEFDEDMDFTGLDGSDINLIHPSFGTYFPSSVSSTARTVTAVFQFIQEGDYTYRLSSSATGFKDLVGFALDGENLGLPSGNGVAGGDYVVPFTVDVGVKNWVNSFTRLNSEASLVYQSNDQRLFSPANDTDTYSVDLDAGQTLSVFVQSFDASLAVSITVHRPDLSSFTVTGNPGENIALNGVIVNTAGSYLVEVESTAGTGNYEVELSLGSSYEVEPISGANNGDILTPENLNFAQVNANIEQAAAVGYNSDFEDEDLYAFELVAGQVVSLSLSRLFNGGGEIGRAFQVLGNSALNLIDASGQQLAASAFTNGNPFELINDFVAPYTGTYYALVSGFTEQEYVLEVLKNAVFEDRTLVDFGFPQPLPSSGNASGYLNGSDNHRYRVDVNTGDNLAINLELPGGGPRLFVNDLDARVLLYDENGLLVADGTNALTYTTLSSGQYVLQVEASTFDSGNYLLNVTGATGPTDGFYVDFTPIGDGERTEAISVYRIEFNDGIRLDTLTSDDILIDGAPVLGFEVYDSSSIGVYLPGLGEGLHTISILPGTILDWQGTPVDGFVRTFDVDLTAPRVIASSLLNDGIANVGSLTYVATFSEPIVQAELGSYTLSGPGGNSSPSGVAYDPVTRELTLTFASLVEGNYTLTLANLFDEVGLALDGEYTLALPSGDGVAGGDFVVEFFVDQTIVPLPAPLSPLGIDGGLVFDSTIEGSFAGIADVDEFTLTLDGGHLATILLRPNNASISSRLEFFGPSGLIQSFDAPAGETAWLMNVPVTAAGNYSIRATQLAGVGSYDLQFILNSSYEREAIGGLSNDTTATAEAIAASSFGLAVGADRLSVLGQTDAGSDYFSFDLQAGQMASLALLSIDTSVLTLELFDAVGRLALSTSGANNVDSVIRDFLAPTAGTYYARVTGPGGSLYQLLVTRGAAFDFEPNNSSTDVAATPLLSDTALGYLGSAVAASSSAAYVRSNVNRPWGSTSPEAAMDLAFGVGRWADLRFETVNATTLFGGSYSFVYLEGSDSTADTLENFLNANRAIIEGFVAAGSSLFINSAPNVGNGMSYGFGGVNLVYGDFGSVVTVVNNAHPIHVGPFLPTSTTYSGGSFSHASVQGGGITPIIVDEDDDAVLAELKWGAGTVLFGGMTTTNFHSPAPAALNLRANTLAYAAAQAGDGLDLYTIDVVAGSIVTVQTTTPSDGPGEFVNLIDPEIRVATPAGTLITHTNVIGNESLSFTAATSGVYTIQVTSRSGKGSYILKVAGTEAISPPLNVVSSTPANGALLINPPPTYRLDFSQPLLISTVQASDLIIDGVPADAVTVIDGDTLEFTISSANTGDGLYTATIAAGAIQSLAGAPLAAFSAVYDADATSPTVVSSSVAQGDTLAPGPFTFLVTFSEELAQPGLGAEDVTLVNSLSGQSFTPASFVYTPGTSTAQVSYGNLPEGNYTLTVLTSATAFRDRRGNLLQGGNFVRNFTVDIGTLAISPIDALAPRGSLLYQGTESGIMNAVGDVDVFEANLDPAQTALFRIVPANGSMRLRAEALDPSGAIVGSLEAASPGDTLQLNALSISAAGTYRLRLTSLTGTGGYTIELYLNTLLEESGNSSLATAQDLSSSSLALPQGASRLAVMGQTQAGVDDFYALSLSAGQYATVGLASLSGGQVAQLALFNEAGVQLAVGQSTSGGQGLNWRIQDFLAATAGVYKLRVSGPAGVKYSLFATRGASFDAESNDTDATAQYIGNTRVALGSIHASQLIIEPDNFPNGTVLTNAFPGVTLTSTNGGVVTATNSGLASTGARVFSSGGGVDWNSSGLMLQANFAFPVSEVSIDVIGDDSSDPGILQAFNAAGTIIAQFTTPAAGPAGAPRVMSISRPQADIAFVRAAGLNGDTANLDNLRIKGDFADIYSFEAVEGSVIDIRTGTPLGAPGEPANALDPTLEVVNAAGFLVASDNNSGGDGRNARTTFTVPAGGAGTYIVRVKAQSNTTGEYTLSILGATPGLGPAPTVTSSTPLAGQRFLAPPTSITLRFSEALLMDSIAATDLTIDGGASVTGVEIVDATTIRYSISVPNLETVYTYNLPAGAVVDLQGRGSIAFSGSFIVDKTGPRVVSQAPALQASAPFNRLVFVFDEAVDAASFTTTDIAAFTGPGGANLLPSVTSITGSGNTFTVNFNNQNTAGTYTLVLGPNITDISGNAMNQNGNTINGEVSDTYTATVQLQSPDLTLPIAIGSPTTAIFGQQINVTWTVQNSGSDPAREAWSDRVYLSSNATLEEGTDILLTTVGAGVNSPLANSASYSRSVNLTLPLLTALSSGTYFVIVKTDALGQQPENNEANNVRAGAAMSVSLPPIADLVVSNIVSPIDALAGQQIPISWTLTNQGTGTATGTWTDQLFLSSDNLVGSDQFFGSFAFTGSIAPGQSVTRTQLITLPQNMQGNRWAIVFTDVSNTIYEHSNEGNNVLVDNAPIDVRIPPLPNLQVTQVTAPPTAFSSQGTQLQWIVTNNGTGATSAPAWYDAVYLSLDSILDASDTYLGEALNPSYLGVGESYASSLNVTLPRGIEGNYHFLVRTDWRSQVFEFENEGDNLGVGAATLVQLTPPPDLRVTQVQPPPLSFSGQPININWTVQNQGEGRTLENAWYDDIYMSADDVLNTGSDFFLGRRLRSGILEPNASYAASQVVTLPIGVSGPFYFFVRTDSFGQVYEHAAENNNDRSILANILLTPPPDLEVSAVSGAANATAGRAYTVTFTVENFGAIGTPNSSWIDTVYLSGNTTLDAGDIKVSDVTRSGALADGAAYDRTVTFTVPNGLQGAFYVLVHTDSSNVVFELDNANNVGFKTLPVNIVSRPADLTVVGSAPSTGEAGKSILVDYTVSNIGTGDTIATSWTDSIFISSDAIFSSDDARLASFTQTGLLNAGSSYGRSQLVDIPFTLSGNYHLFVVTDRNGVVFESNEANNVSSAIPIAITRQVPDLQVLSVSPPPSAQAGTDLTMSWTVRNFGLNRTNTNFWYDEVWLSNDSTISNDDFRLGNIRRSGALSSLEEYTTTSTFRLPDNRSGPLFLVVRTDATNQVLEDTLEGNNDRATAISVAANPAAAARPDLEVTSVLAPNDAFSGQSFPLTWTVRNNDVGTIRNWYDAVYLSRDQIFDRDTDTYLGFRSQSGLAAGAVYTATQSFSVPNGFSGPFYVFVIADAGATVDEAGRDANNVGVDSGSMLVTLAPPADLIVGTISVPTTASLGRTATIQFTITNQGANAARGSWFDSVFLSSDDTWDVGDLLFGRTQRVGDVAGGASYTSTITSSIPGLNPGDYHIIIRSDIRNNIPESNEANNIGASLDLVDIDIESLTLGVPASDSLSQGKSSFYRVDVPAGETLVVTLDSVSTTAANELYVRYGDVPSRVQFDHAFSDPVSSDQRIVIPFTRGGTYYILAYGASSAVSASYNITATIPTFSIVEVGPNAGSNRGLTTVRIEGSRFVQGGQVDLQGPGGTRAANKVWWKDSTEVWATFDLQGLAIGSYNVRIHQGVDTAIAAGAFTVNNLNVGELSVQVNAPNTLRPGQPGVVTVNYANTGNSDIPAPVLTLSVSNALLRLSDGSDRNQAEFLGIAPNGPAGILSPGARSSVSFVYNPTIDFGEIAFELSELPASQPIDWEARKAEARPAGTSAAAWDIIWANYTAALGSTGAGLRAVLDDNANHLSQLGMRINDTARLLRFEMQQADGSLFESVQMSPASTGSFIDMAATPDSVDFARQLPLFLARNFGSGIEGRFRDGAFGRGWTHNWEISVDEAVEGVVAIYQGAGSRLFVPAVGGGYVGLPGEQGTLTKDGGRFRLVEPAGIAYQFRADGTLESVSDNYSNRINLTFTSGRLTSLVHTDGESLTILYNAAGNISQITDDAGRTVTYLYDASGEHLVSVTGEDGVTTYASQSAAGPTQHALLSITHPDGERISFQYDATGRQVGHSLNGGAESITYAYDSAGGVTLTDGLGNASRVLLTDFGASGRVTDANGQVTQLFYNASGLLRLVINPAGASSTFNYDAQGNLLSNQDALGQSVSFTYDPTLQQIRTVRDPLGRTLRYDYDARGNLLSVAYPDGSTERFTVSASTGVTDAITNRRNQETRLSYDARGRVIRKDFADGTFATYSYDAKDNLLTASDADSNVTFTYDAQGRMQRVTYDTGRFVQFQYDTIGRRTQISDGAGYVVNYAYTAAGRLDELTDGSAARIVKYSYDVRGNLSREDNGNGTSTVYSYGPTNELLSVVNYASDGTTVNSRFAYTYDRAGRRSSMSTLAGITNYGYDALGQLTLVTLPGGRTVEYRYDAAGNRTAVIDSGVTTTYAGNNLNQYTSVGGTVYSYDADGNLVGRTIGGVSWTYLFDSENRMTRATSSAGDVWQYIYDALGNRVASIHNGQRTDFLVDPTGWGDVVAEYGPAGQVSHFSYGVGLVGQIAADGTKAFYDFDAMGNTVGISGAGGSYVNSYSYLPYGEALLAAEGLPNSFEFGGQWGVSRNADGLDFMRARYYDAATGRFVSVDPLRVQSGDINFYRFAQNNPVSASDPTGQILFAPIIVGAGIGAALDIGIQLIGNGGDFGNINWGSVAVSAGLGALGGAAGTIAKGGKGIEFSHWIPGRYSNPNSPFYKGLPRWLTENRTFNGNYVPNWFHAATDPYRLMKGMKKWGDHLYPGWLRQILRVPGWLSGGLLGPLGGALTRLIRPSDPNDIVGPAGFGDERWVTATETLPYTIRFENRAEATAPAQVVRISHPLDPDLDPRTFRLGNFGWSGMTFEVPENKAFFFGRVDVREEQGIFVDVLAGYDTDKQEAFWLFTAIDPETGEQPEDASVGFLPPNDENHVGEGFVNYTIRSRRNSQTGTVIDALATIIFDTEEPLATPPIFNTLDAVAPSSQVEALPAVVSSADSTVLVKWSGEDDEGGSALGSFTIYVSDNGGPFTPWLEDTQLTEAKFVGVAGRTYAFYSRARDNAGNLEAPPATADTSALFASGDVTPPEVLDVTDITPDPRNASVVSAEFEVSEELDLASLKESSLTLTRNGVAVTIPAGSLTFARVPNTLRYTVSGLGPLTLPEGDYQLTINGPGLKDLAGNAGVGTPGDSWKMDTTKPTSRANALTSTQTTLVFPVSVTASDPVSGSVSAGLMSISIYVSINGGAWSFWRTVPPNATTANYTGVSNTTYSFYTTSRDLAGNIETKTPRVEATTYVPDLTPPTTQVTQVLAATPTFQVSMTGTDEGGTLAFFNLFVQIDNNPPQQVAQLAAGGATGGVYTQNVTYQAIQDGQQHVYRFYTVGVDVRGNIEAAPATGDIIVSAQFAAPAALEVANFDVQKNATQRSFVRYLDVTFNRNDAAIAAMVASVQDLDTTNDRIKVTRKGLSYATSEAVALKDRVSAVDQVMAFDFTSTGIGGNRSGNVGDGYYDLELDLDGNLANGYEVLKRFYRLLGDVTGDKVVNAADLTAWDQRNQPGGIGANADANGDGLVNASDRTLVSRAVGRQLLVDRALDD